MGTFVPGTWKWSKRLGDPFLPNTLPWAYTPPYMPRWVCESGRLSQVERWLGCVSLCRPCPHSFIKVLLQSVSPGWYHAVAPTPPVDISSGKKVDNQLVKSPHFTDAETEVLRIAKNTQLELVPRLLALWLGFSHSPQQHSLPEFWLVPGRHRLLTPAYTLAGVSHKGKAGPAVHTPRGKTASLAPPDTSPSSCHTDG